jgi:hypothetical protein
MLICRYHNAEPDKLHLSASNIVYHMYFQCLTESILSHILNLYFADKEDN